MHPLKFVQGLSVASHPSREVALLPVGMQVIWIQFDGSFESLLGASPVVVSNLSDLSQGDIGVGKGVVEP